MTTEELGPILQPAIERFTTGDYYREVFQAKQEFFERAGVVFEDDPEFEQRMSLFMDWYLFDRDLPGADLPPIRVYQREQADRMTDAQAQVFHDLSQSIHTLFRVVRFKWFSRDIVVQDLFSKKKMVVKDPRLAQAFAPGDIFEGRIFKHQGAWHFTQGFCFHPVEMKSFILGEIKKIRHQERARHIKFILQLAQMKLKHQRFSHIDVEQIYRHDSRI